MNFIPPAVGASTGLLDGVIAARYARDRIFYRGGLAAAGAVMQATRVVPEDVSVSMQVCGLYGFAASLVQRAMGNPTA